MKFDMASFHLDVVSVASGRSQKIYISDNPHDDDLYHWINFLFVLKDFQVSTRF